MIMAEYINREEAIEAAKHAWAKGLELSQYLEIIPAADVSPVRHGRWVKRGCKWQCTQCKVLMSIDGTPKENLLNYCPNCGADMRGRNDE